MVVVLSMAAAAATPLGAFVKVKNPTAPAVRREPEEYWSR
jgi:hypothetical protein